MEIEKEKKLLESGNTNLHSHLLHFSSHYSQYFYTIQALCVLSISLRAHSRKKERNKEKKNKDFPQQKNLFLTLSHCYLMLAGMTPVVLDVKLLFNVR